MNFVAIDLETANFDYSTICQVGIAKYEDGNLVDEWKSYVDPEDYFDDWHVSRHGIDESVVAGAPTYPQLTEIIFSYIQDSVVVSHTAFDRVSISQASNKYSIEVPKYIWLDSARVARRTWEECAQKGYGLANICYMLGYDFQHHDALEDAKAAAHILVAASCRTGLDIEGWLKRVQQPINPSERRSRKAGNREAIKRDGDPGGAHYGEVVVFTGTLEIPRREAADLAAAIGCRVSPGVNKETTLLVVGDQDIKKLAGRNKSSKQRKAEELIKKGVSIRILCESDFKELSKLSK